MLLRRAPGDRSLDPESYILLPRNTWLLTAAAMLPAARGPRSQPRFRIQPPDPRSPEPGDRGSRLASGPEAAAPTSAAIAHALRRTAAAGLVRYPSRGPRSGTMGPDSYIFR